MPPPSSTLLLFFLALQAAANTEIRNFQVSLDAPDASDASDIRDALSLPAAAAWQLHTLNATHNERSFSVPPAPLGTPLQAVCEPAGDDGDGDGDVDSDVGVGVQDAATGSCPYELWLELDVDDASWTRFARFTIRISWPAFYPTDFDIALYSAQELSMHLHRNDRTEDAPLRSPDEESSLKVSHRSKYARIRLVDTGIRPPSSTRSSSDQTAEAVPFTVILEPLLFGVLPATVVLTILFLIPVLAVVAFLFPYVMRYLEDVAAEARRELYGSEKPKLS